MISPAEIIISLGIYAIGHLFGFIHGKLSTNKNVQGKKV